MFPRDTRNLGIYIAGLPGYGKSTLIQNLFLEDIDEDYGACIIDPGGDLIADTIHHVPKKRIDDIILFDTSDPIPIDFFTYVDDTERQVLVDMLLGIFKLEEAPVGEPTLMQIIGTLLDANDTDIPDKHRCTLLDIHNFITNKDRRNEILEYVPHRKEEWAGELFKPFDFRAILRRFRRFLEIKSLRTMFGAKRPPINIAQVMAEKKILLISLRETKSDYDIAALVAAKFRQATFGRRDIEEDDRVPFYLYIDECHTVLEFAEKDFNDLLTRARKFQLCLTLANQFPSDLPKSIQSKLSVFQTSVIFRTKPDSIGPFKSLFPPHVPAPEYPRRRDRLVDKKEQLVEKCERIKSQRDGHWAQFMNSNQKYGDFFEPNEMQRYNQQIQSFEEHITELERDIEDIDEQYNEALDDVTPDFARLAASLSKGEAIFIEVDGDPYVADTPDPPEKHPRNDGCAKYLKDHYAEYLRKRNVEKDACNPPKERSTTDDELAHPDEDIASSPPNVPSHERKKTNAGTAR